jgi:hypothetical protein
VYDPIPMSDRLATVDSNSEPDPRRDPEFSLRGGNCGPCLSLFEAESAVEFEDVELVLVLVLVLEPERGGSGGNSLSNPALAACESELGYPSCPPKVAGEYLIYCCPIDFCS